MPETILWRAVRRSGLGIRIRRQHPAGIYVLDFYCAPLKLAIEVDGAAHDCGDRPAHDARRDAWLETQGVRVVRIGARDMLGNLDGVIGHLRALVGEVAAPSSMRGHDMAETGG